MSRQFASVRPSVSRFCLCSFGVSHCILLVLFFHLDLQPPKLLRGKSAEWGGKRSRGDVPTKRQNTLFDRDTPLAGSQPTLCPLGTRPHGYATRERLSWSCEARGKLPHEMHLAAPARLPSCRTIWAWAPCPHHARLATLAAPRHEARRTDGAASGTRRACRVA